MKLHIHWQIKLMSECSTNTVHLIKQGVSFKINSTEIYHCNIHTCPRKTFMCTLGQQWAYVTCKPGDKLQTTVSCMHAPLLIFWQVWMPREVVCQGKAHHWNRKNSFSRLNQWVPQGINKQTYSLKDQLTHAFTERWTTGNMVKAGQTEYKI